LGKVWTSFFEHIALFFGDFLAGALLDGPLIFMIIMINYDWKYLFKLNLS